MFYFDAHNHLCHDSYPDIPGGAYGCISSFGSEDEWNSFAYHDRSAVLRSFGIHPQSFANAGAVPDDFERGFAFMEKLASEGKLYAVGEIGLDFFEERFRAVSSLQEEFWLRQVDFAGKMSLPVVVHCRKAMEKIHSDARILSSLPAVVFHSFPGNSADARCLLRRGVNAFFSFGKHQVLNGKKATFEMLSRAGEFRGRIFLETDCPYQTLRGERSTSSSEIVRVYEAASRLFGADFFDITAESFSRLPKPARIP